MYSQALLNEKLSQYDKCYSPQLAEYIIELETKLKAAPIINGVRRDTTNFERYHAIVLKQLLGLVGFNFEYLGGNEDVIEHTDGVCDNIICNIKTSTAILDKSGKVRADYFSTTWKNSPNQWDRLNRKECIINRFDMFDLHILSRIHIPKETYYCSIIDKPTFNQWINGANERSKKPKSSGDLTLSLYITDLPHFIMPYGKYRNYL